MSIIDRIRAHGGEVTRTEWRISIRRGRLDDNALAWLRDRKTDILREVWPKFDQFEERAAIMEFDAGLSRDEAEAAAYREVSGC